ncbi:MAG: glycoside hydrolase family 16 protein [Saprospiraceae bacterium]|nr:glycoside hydrolase family 16 protein [Saprospiraceae bacterium]
MLQAQPRYEAPLGGVVFLQSAFYTGDTTDAVHLTNYPEPDLHIFLKKNMTHPGCDERPYTTVFEDGFDTSELDKTKWLDYYPYPHPFDTLHNPGSNSAYLAENVTVDDSILSLQTQRLDKPLRFRWQEIPGAPLYTKRIKWSSGVVHTNNRLPTSDNPSGCFRFGKFCASIRIPSTRKHWGAFWLYGWPGEIDIFEFCLPDCDELQSTLHQWNIPMPGWGPQGHPAYPQDHQFGDLSTDFHEYCLEWTPYKMEWSLDGKPFRTFYRYYRMDSNADSLVLVGLECPDIPIGDSVEVYEHIAWNKFDLFYLDLILNTTVSGNPRKLSDVMQVDWVKVQQRKAMQITGPTVLENFDSTYTFSWTGSDVPDQLDWELSEGIELAAVTDTSLALRPIPGFSGRVWIRAVVPNNESCYPLYLEKQLYLPR